MNKNGIVIVALLVAVTIFSCYVIWEMVPFYPARILGLVTTLVLSGLTIAGFIIENWRR